MFGPEAASDYLMSFFAGILAARDCRGSRKDWRRALGKKGRPAVQPSWGSQVRSRAHREFGSQVKCAASSRPEATGWRGSIPWKLHGGQGKLSTPDSKLLTQRS